MIEFHFANLCVLSRWSRNESFLQAWNAEFVASADLLHQVDVPRRGPIYYFGREQPEASAKRVHVSLCMRDPRRPQVLRRVAISRTLPTLGRIGLRSQIYATILTTELAALLISGALAVQSHSAEDSSGLFQRVKDRMAEHLSQLPNYTCHETVDRMLRVGANFRYLDTVDLEVAFFGKRELFARTGEDRFGEQTIDKLVPGGTMADSAMGSPIDVIFSQDAAAFIYAGECKKDGRRAVRFDMVVPIEKSGFRIRHNGAVGMAGYQGSIWVDAQTLDLVRVDFKVNRIPTYLGIRVVEESLHYKKLTIGNSEFHLPDRSELTATDDKGYSTLNMIKLVRCREFGADSVVKYGAPVPAQGTASRDRQDH
jgi:hypothetical protein